MTRSTPDRPAPVLEVQQLAASFGTRPGLRDISLAVPAGDCVAVLGASGVGKSTLLRAIAGLQPMRGGRVLVHGRDVSGRPPEERGVVYLHQEPVLFPHLSVLDNVAFPAIVRGRTRAEARAGALPWLERLQVGTLTSRRPAALSGGQRHRVALARALAAEPAALLLDEPLAALDPTVRRDVRAALADVRDASGVAMVLVTHELDDALALASRMVLLHDGTVVADQRPESLLAAPPSLVVARALGVFTEIVGTVEPTSDGARFAWGGGVVAIPQPLPAGPAVACVRPHQVSLRRAAHTSRSAVRLVSRRATAHAVELLVAGPRGAPGPLPLAWDNGDFVVGEWVEVTLTAPAVFPLAPSGR